TASYQTKNLQGIGLASNNMTGWDFSGQNLTGADLYSSRLTNANLTGAVVTGAMFWGTTSRGFTQAQLASTSSYQTKNLQGIWLGNNDLTGWDFSGQNLTNANLEASTLTNANLAGAIVADVRFSGETGFDLTKEQLYSTASYQQKELQGIELSNNDLRGWDLSGQDLTGANFYHSALTDVSLVGATIIGADFNETRLTQSQLYSTASYRQKNLRGVKLPGNGGTGWELSGQDLTGASFFVEGGICCEFAILTNTNLSGAIVNGADFSLSDDFSKEQLYSTASYQRKDLADIVLSGNDLSGWNFAGQNLARAVFLNADLFHSNLSHANLTSASFTTDSDVNQSRLVNADLSFADLRLATYNSLDGALVRNAILREGTIDGLNLAAGERLVAHAGVPLAVKLTGDVSIAPTATFDLTDNAAIINYSGASPVATVRQQILAGRGGSGLGKTWNGQGITSSSAAAAQPESRSIGYAENSALPLGSYTSFRGQAVDDTSLLMAYTRTGDANLDGIVNDDDVTIVSATYAPGVSQPYWALGDFDYNGFVDDDDVTLLGVFYDPAAAPLIASAAAHAGDVAAVPEPTTILLASTAGLLLLLIRRRVHRRHLTVTCGVPILSSSDSPLGAGCNASGQEPSRSFG
ncbi:MAG: pentapeptide repeat-containing protein, partial [Pirellulales bacterium]